MASGIFNLESVGVWPAAASAVAAGSPGSARFLSLLDGCLGGKQEGGEQEDGGEPAAGLPLCLPLFCGVPAPCTPVPVAAGAGSIPTAAAETVPLGSSLGAAPAPAQAGAQPDSPPKAAAADRAAGLVIAVAPSPETAQGVRTPAAPEATVVETAEGSGANAPAPAESDRTQPAPANPARRRGAARIPHEEDTAVKKIALKVRPAVETLPEAGAEKDPNETTVEIPVQVESGQDTNSNVMASPPVAASTPGATAPPSDGAAPGQERLGPTPPKSANDNGRLPAGAGKVSMRPGGGPLPAPVAFAVRMVADAATAAEEPGRQPEAAAGVSPTNKTLTPSASAVADDGTLSPAEPQHASKVPAGTRPNPLPEASVSAERTEEAAPKPAVLPAQAGQGAGLRSATDPVPRAIQVEEKSGRTSPEGAIAAPAEAARRAPETPGKEEAPAAARVEPEQPQRPGAPVRNLTLRLDGQDQNIGLRLAERGGQIHVAVHAPEGELNRHMKDQLPELVRDLGREGFSAETWRPAGNSSQPDRGQHGAQDAPAGGESGGAHQDGRGRRRSPQPGWVQEIDSLEAEPERSGSQWQ